MKKNRLKTLILVLSSISFLATGLSLALPSRDYQQLSAAVKVEIKEVEPFVYCSLSRTGSFAEIEAAVGELLQQMQAQNVFPMGSMIGIYHGDPTLSDPEQIQWEVGFPVNDQALVQAPLQKRQWTFTTVAVGLHEGPYEKTGETILGMRQWLEDNGYVQNGPILERYLDADPATTSPDRLKTEIWLPCRKV
ncbi:MAG: GyrI-like domain-containing protein [Candidatus Saccharicenans sp.]|mgnify:FL=1|nr:GyrI-like domain-containing protein [Candidatus Saccharicenans sp.]